MEFEQTVDYVIIGGGSAGCVLAARLSEDPKTSVVLLEAGGEDNHPLIHVPAGYVKTMVNPAVNWMFEAEPEAGTANRALTMPRGKVLGGSSAINAMLYVRGQPADYDGWSQRGNHGWSYDDVLPFFRKAEYCEFVTTQTTTRGSGPTTILALPSQKCPIAIFSEVASQCISTTVAATCPPRGCFDNIASTAENGSSNGRFMKTCPRTCATKTLRPRVAVKIAAPRPGADFEKLSGRMMRGSVSINCSMSF